MIPSMVRSSTRWPASITVLAARPGSLPAATRRLAQEVAGGHLRNAAARLETLRPLRASHPSRAHPAERGLIFRVTPRAPARRAAPILPRGVRVASNQHLSIGYASPPTGRSAPAKRI